LDPSAAGSSDALGGADHENLQRGAGRGSRSWLERARIAAASRSPAALIARARAWLLPTSGAPASRIEPIATLILVLLSTVLRFQGVALGRTIGFWNDEAAWAIRVVEQPLRDLLIRPIGFMAVTRLFVTVFGNSELTFRLLPWLAGLTTPLIAALLARRFLHGAAARLLFIGFLGVSSLAVDFSKEFKPYAISLMLHLLLPLLALRWSESGRARDLVWTGIVAALGLFFAQDVIFLYPGLFLVLAWEARKRRRPRQLFAVVGFAVLSASIVLGMYVLIWKRLPKDQTEYWGDKYGVFHRPKDRTDTAVDWYASKYVEIAEIPAGPRSMLESNAIGPAYLHELASAHYLLMFGLHLVGLSVLVRQRRVREALLFLSPTLVCGVVNFLGLWPYGTFRTNLFLLAGMSAVASLGLDWKGRARSTWLSVAPVTLLVILPFLVARRDLGSTKRLIPASQMAEVIEQMLSVEARQNARREPLYLVAHCYSIFHYYVGYHERVSRWSEKVNGRFDWQHSATPEDVFASVRQLPADERAWIMVRGRHPSPPADLRAREVLQQDKMTVYVVQAPPRH
jgi:4-amino-4-deoxy-L-arabinose transferase-like glycosyltransferase